MASKNKTLSVAADIFGGTIDGTIRKIPIKEIQPDENQPRLNRDINIQTLADSLKEEGLLQPIVVTRNGNHFSIIAGERRFRAATLLGWKEIECRIISKSGKEKYKLAVIENLQRENLDPIEEAFALKKLKSQYSYTDSDISSIIGKSRNYISEILSITEIPAAWLERAGQAGIQSKNLLIQFAQAVKLGAGDTFLERYQRGEIATVKAAKDFIQNEKGNTPVVKPAEEIPKPSAEIISRAPESKPTIYPTENQPPNYTIPKTEPAREIYPAQPENVQIQASWLNDSKLRIQIDLENAQELTFPLESLQTQLKIALNQIIQELQNQQ